MKRMDDMDATQRRDAIVSILQLEIEPMSASKLAKKFGVSRQVIVGDVSLLRAGGVDIAATPKGYLLETKMSSQSGNQSFIGKIACQHSTEQTQDELYTVVDNGGELLDVIVEHPIYGELTGRLNIATREDANAFMKRISETKTGLLSDLTNGIHLHTLACSDKKNFEIIRSKLEALDVLYKS